MERVPLGLSRKLLAAGRGKNSRQMLSFRFPLSEADGRSLLGMISIDITEQGKH